MNTRTKRTLLRCIRIAAGLTIFQLVLVVLVSLRLRGSYPGVVDVSDYVPDIEHASVLDLVRGRRGQQRPHFDEVFNVPEWQTRGLSGAANHSRSSTSVKANYYLTQVLHVRLYKGDKANWTIKELKQWMHYMYFAGVEHIFICDHAQRDFEKIQRHLENYIKLDLVTYIHWPLPKNVVKSKLDCYRYFMKELEGRNEWQVSVDMDEYPFVPKDLQEGFLTRYLKKLESDVVQVLMENFLMLGDGDRNKSMVMERIVRRTQIKANKLTKPIYRPDHTRPGMHRFYERRTTRRLIHTISGGADEILMLHYWGTRLERMGQDKEEVMEMTQDYPVIRDWIAPRIRNSLIAFGEFEAFSTDSGP